MFAAANGLNGDFSNAYQLSVIFLNLSVYSLAVSAFDVIIKK